MKVIMQDMKDKISRNLVTITIVFGFLFHSFFLFSHNIEHLILNTIPDDGFYYQQVARNIVTGCGSTMDCANITNGYHPLWMIVLLLIYKFFSVGGSNDVVPIYLALFVSVCFFTLSAFYLSKVLKSFTDSRLVISFSLFFYFFNPYILYNVLNGLETGLLLFLLTLFLYKSIVFEKEPSDKNAVLFGLVGGLLVLARLDMVFVVLVSTLFVWYKSNFKNFIFAGLATQVFFLPWFVYNYLTFNMLFTSASRTSTYINHLLTYSDNGGYSLFLFIKTIIYMLDRALYQVLSNTGAYVLVLPFFGMFIYFVLENYKREVDSMRYFKNLSPISFVLAGNILLIFISAGLRWTFRSWYFMPIMIFVSIMLGIVMEVLNKRGFQMRKIIGATTLLFIFFFYITFEKELKDAQILQKQMYEVTLWQNENLPLQSAQGEPTHVGVFNAGIQTYFSKHKVTNLDGLVNNKASEAMMSNTLWQYITKTEHIDYIADFDSYMTYRYKDSFRDESGQLFDPTSSTTMQKIYTIPGPKDLNVYKVIYTK